MKDVDADYRRAGFGASLSPGSQPALLIIDMVRAYLDPASPLKLDGNGALDAASMLAGIARENDVPVVFTTVRYTPGGREGGLFYRKVPALAAFVDESPLGAFPELLTPQAGDLVIVKHYPSAFFGTSLASTLRGMGVDTLIITGFSTSGCVRATALDALCHGFVPLVVSDACADRTPSIHDQNLFDIRNKMAEVIGLDEARSVLTRRACA